MVQAYKDFWKRYADFNGKATRSDFWYATLMNFLIVFGGLLIVIISAATAYGTIVSHDELEKGAAFSGGSILLIIFYLALSIYFLASIVPSIAISTRRLRDAGLPWALIFLYVIPFGGFVLLVLFCQPSANQPTNNSERDEM